MAALQDASVSQTITSSIVAVEQLVNVELNLTSQGDENISGSITQQFNPAVVNVSGVDPVPDLLDYAVGNITWNIINLAPAASFIAALNFTGVAPGMSYLNASFINGSEDILASANGSLQSINVTVSKTALNATAQVDDNITFIINVTNVGAQIVENLTLRDQFTDAMLSFLGSSLPSSPAGAGQREWYLNLTGSSSTIIEVNFTVNGTGNATNNVTVLTSQMSALASANASTMVQGAASADYSNMWAQAQPARFFTGDIANFLFGAPYVARGDGCYREPNQASSYSTPGENCCSTKDFNGGDGCNGAGDPNYDTAAVFVAQYQDLIAWRIVGSFSDDVRNLSICDGVNRSVAFAVEFDFDDNTSTGCNSQNESCYPGADYQIWFFPDSNTTLFANYTSINADLVSFGANISISGNATWVHYDCDPSDAKEKGVTIILNKTAAFGNLTPKLNFETNTFNVTEHTTNPIDLLTNYGSGGTVDAWLVTGPSQDQGECHLYDNTNQTGCVSNNQSLKCIWNDFGNGNGLCDPDFANFAQGTSCFTIGSQSLCDDNANNDVGYCRWEPSVTLPNGSTGLCVEQFKPFEFSSGDCATDCFNCFTQDQCANSEANGGSDWGGCSWYSDTFRPGGWCDVKGVQMGCANTSDDCYGQTDCQNAGWIWNATWEFCVPQAGVEICFNGIDDDGNGNTDCDDEYCRSSRSCGGHINTLTGAYKGLDPELALQQKLGVGMGRVLELKQDDPGDQSNATLNIEGFGAVVSTFGIGVGMMIEDLSDLYACGGGVQEYRSLFLIDTDVNSSSGCNATIDGTVREGYEYMIKYGGQYGEVNESASENIFYACYQGGWVVRAAATDPVLSPENPGVPNSPETPIECNGDAIAIMMEKADIGNPDSDIRFLGSIIAGSYANVSNLTSYDIIDQVYYTPGTQDFTPVDCFAEPSKCGAEFTILGSGDYLPIEDCIAPGDEDIDGLTNCADSDCALVPQCAGQYNFSADKTSPKVKSSTVKRFNNLATINWIMSEPTNGTVKFYGTDATCTTLNATIIDEGQPGVTFDDFKPWHGIPLDDRSLGSFLSASTTYYYKIADTDASNNTATSACLNFTTTGSASNVTMFFNFTPGVNESDFLGNLEIKVNNEPLVVGSASERDPSIDRNANLTFGNPNASENTNWSLTLVGVDLTQQASIDFDDAFIANESENNESVIGLENGDWLVLAQKFGADYVLLQIPEPKDSLFHCADNGTECTNVTGTEGVELIANGTNHTIWKLPTSLGFSAYTARGSTVTAPTSASSTSPSTTSSASSGGGGSGGTLSAGNAGASDEGLGKHTISNAGIHRFMISGREHRITIKAIDEDTVTFIVESEPIEVTLSSGEERAVDLDRDGIDEILLRLTQFTASTVTFEIESLIPDAPAQDPLAQEEMQGAGEQLPSTAPSAQDAVSTEEEREDAARDEPRGIAWLWWSILGVAVLLILLLAILGRNPQRHR